MGKRILFKEVRIEGFCGIAKTLTYKLDVKGITIIRGVNGISKTTIFSAVYWAIYAKTLKKSLSPTTWEDKQPRTYRGTKVELDFKIGKYIYTIIRCFKFTGDVEGARGNSRLLLLKDGIYQEDHRDKGDVKAQILKLIGYSPELFKNSVLFGQKLTRLISETGPKKKELFEQAFEVGFITDAKKRAMDKRSEIAELIADNQNKVNLLRAQLDSLKEQESDIKANTLSFKHDQEKKIEVAEKKHMDQQELFLKLEKDLVVPDEKALEKLKSLVEKARKKQEKLPELEATLRSKLANRDQLARKITVAEFDLHKAKAELEKIPTKCSTCGAPLDKRGVKKAIAKAEVDVEDETEALRDYNLLLDSFDKAIGILREQVSKYEPLKREILKTGKKISKIESSKYQYERDKAKVEQAREQIGVDERALLAIYKEKPPYKKMLTKCKAKIEKIHEDLREPTNRLKRLTRTKEAYDWVINEPLSNKGLKAYIFSSLIEDINLELDKYSGTLGYRVNFAIDLESKKKDFETTLYQGNRIRKYDDLSGGQQQLVDVAIAFAMHDVMSKGRPTNMLLMDEIFEGLDDPNIEKVVELVRDKSLGICVHLITHRKGFTVVNARELEIKLVKGSPDVMSL